MTVVPYDTVTVLERRLEFLENIREVATQCNWSEKNMQELHGWALEEVIRIDNAVFSAYEESSDFKYAQHVWQGNMENLRYWLELILEVKIKFT